MRVQPQLQKRRLRVAFFIGIFTLMLMPKAYAVATPQSREEIQLSFAPVVRQAAPAVVNIYTKREIVERGLSPFANDPFFQHFFGGRGRFFGSMPRKRVVRSLGSGVIVDPKGLVITNDHVIKEASDIRVVLNDQREYAAEIRLRDEQSDLALLELQAVDTPLRALALRDSDELEVGDLVLAIGNPFGVGQTVTSGIISATARSAAGVGDFGFFLQTDAAINPGNSGGALVDLQGRLVGIPNAIYTRSGGSNGIGFAIPANMVRLLLRGDVRQGRILKPWLGAKYQNVTREIADSLGLERASGVLVTSVFDDSPADRAGLRAGDVIIGFGGETVFDLQALRFRITVAQVARSESITFIRDGKQKERELMLEYPPDKPDRDERELTGAHPLRGVKVANLNPALAMELNMEPQQDTVVIVSEGRNFRRGDIVHEINGTRIKTSRQLQALLDNAGGQIEWEMEFLRDGQPIGLRVMR